MPSRRSRRGAGLRSAEREQGLLARLATLEGVGTLAKSVVAAPFTLAPDLLGQMGALNPLQPNQESVSGDAIRQLLGIEAGDPLVMAGEFLDPSTAAVKAGSKIPELLSAGTALAARVSKPIAKAPRIPLDSTDIISSRRPTAVKAPENPETEYLRVDLEAAARDPKAFQKNVGVVTEYPNYRPMRGVTSSHGRAENFITDVEDNLLWLHDQVPLEIRQRAQNWYDGANVIAGRFAQQFPGLNKRQYAGVIASLSPQKDWYQNASLAERVLGIKTQLGAHAFDSGMAEVARRVPIGQPYLQAIAGKRLDQLQDPIQQAWWLRLFDEAHNPREYRILSPEGESLGLAMTMAGEPKRVAWGSAGEIGKAIRIIEDGSVSNISQTLGDMHKVRSFNNNIVDPNNPLGDVTIDTHAVAAGLLRPLSGNSLEVGHAFGGTGSANSSVFGVKGTYPLYAEAYRRAADKRGLLPRQMQSITWEASRGLFTPVLKRNKTFIQQTDKIWDNYRKKRITINEAREQIHDISGGIDAPEWHGPDRPITSINGPRGQQGQLPDGSLRRPTAPADGRGRGRAAGVGADVDLSRFDDRLQATV